MVLSEIQILLVAHTPALQVYLSLACNPIWPFFPRFLEHHHTIYHLPLCPRGPTVERAILVPSPFFTPKTPGVWLSFPSSWKPLHGPLSTAPSSLPSWYLSRVCPCPEPGHWLTRETVWVISNRKKRIHLKQLKKTWQGTSLQVQ